MCAGYSCLNQSLSLGVAKDKQNQHNFATHGELLEILYVHGVSQREQV